MIHQKTEAGLLILSGTDDADRPEIEALARAALGKRHRVNVFRTLAGAAHMIAAMKPVGSEIHVRGPSGSARASTPREAAHRGLSRFMAANLGAT